MSINCLLIRRPWGIGLLVAATDAARAESELAAFEDENQPRDSPAPAHAPREVVDAALVASALVVASQIAAEGSYFSADWFTAGAANASLIFAGEWWRSVTALGLHGDLGHLLSNIVFGGALGVIVAGAPSASAGSPSMSGAPAMC
jgi:hypothetical protein